MSGLFLNFYQVKIESKEVIAKILNYSEYSTKEKFVELRNSNRNCTLYREDDKILVWSHEELKDEFQQLPDYKVELSENPKVLSRILENGIVNLLRKTNSYRIYKNKYSNTWDIISNVDVLNNTIEGIVLNRVVHFSPYFCYKDQKLLIGFTLSTSLKN